MPNLEHLSILARGQQIWNGWREENPTITPDLSSVDLSSANLRSFDLSFTDLSHAVLSGADLTQADLSNANIQSSIADSVILSGANLRFCNLSDARLDRASCHSADFSEATACNVSLVEANLCLTNLRRTHLEGSNLTKCDFSEAEAVETQFTHATLNDATLYRTDLTAANLQHAQVLRADLALSIMVRTELDHANFTNCSVYGVSVWDASLTGTVQKDLRITPVYRYPYVGFSTDEPSVTVDDLEVAQFVHLLLRNDRLKSVIDTIGSKGVLILGRFTPERKQVLDVIREKLRSLNFVPMMFDFERPTQRDFTETIKTLAGLSRFIIADITNPKSSPLELQATMPDYMIPFIPIIEESEEPFSMFRDLKQKYGAWVLDVLKYDTPANLMVAFEAAVVRPALELSELLIMKKAEAIRTRHVSEYV